MFKVLIVSDEVPFLLTTNTAPKAMDHFYIESLGGDKGGVEKVLTHSYDVVLLDGDTLTRNGQEALRYIKKHSPTTTVIMLTTNTQVTEADDCLSKSTLSKNIVKIVRPSLLKIKNSHLKEDTSEPTLKWSNGKKMIGHSDYMKKNIHYY